MPDFNLPFETPSGISSSGTITATTAAVGTNTTQVATTAFVQNEIVADAVTAFNGRTGAVQGVSSAAAGAGISVSAATGAVTITNTGVLSFNGNTGAVTGASLGANTFTGLNTFNAGLSASGTTAAFFNGTVDANSSTVYRPTLRYYNEPTSSPAISSNTLTLDLSAAQVFTVSLNSAVNTLSITNTPSTANRSIGFTLIFTADGTPRSVTWGSAIKWAAGASPSLTSTNGKKDVFTFLSTDAGTSWLAFVGGQNF